MGPDVRRESTSHPSQENINELKAPALSGIEKFHSNKKHKFEMYFIDERVDCIWFVQEYHLIF